MHNRSQKLHCDVVWIPTMTVHASFHCVSVIDGTALYQL